MTAPNKPIIFQITVDGKARPISEAERAALLRKLRCGQNAPFQPVVRCVEATADRRAS
jgi:hypothetical protein